MTDIKNATLPDFSWHQAAWDRFVLSRKKDHLPHAFLLSGEEGIAKFELAKRMAKSLICINTSGSSFDACGQCQSCKTYESGANPDFLQIGLLEDKQQIAVDQIRSLSEFLNYSRSYNTYRVVIINPVERMNLNAANSLLKSLEEPANNTVILLITSKVSDLLATIKSRCQLLNITTPSKKQTLEWLNEYTLKNASHKIESEIMFDNVGSKPLNAIQLSQEDIDSKQDFYNDIAAVNSKKSAINDIAKKWEKHNPEVLLDWQIKLIQASIKSSMSGKSIDHSNHQFMQHFTLEKQWLLYQTLIQQKQYIHTSVNSLMFVENMLLLWI